MSSELNSLLSTLQVQRLSEEAHETIESAALLEENRSLTTAVASLKKQLEDASRGSSGLPTSPPKPPAEHIIQLMQQVDTLQHNLREVTAERDLLLKGANTTAQAAEIAALRQELQQARVAAAAANPLDESRRTEAPLAALTKPIASADGNGEDQRDGSSEVGVTVDGETGPSAERVERARSISAELETAKSELAERTSEFRARDERISNLEAQLAATTQSAAASAHHAKELQERLSSLEFEHQELLDLMAETQS